MSYWYLCSAMCVRVRRKYAHTNGLLMARTCLFIQHPRMVAWLAALFCYLGCIAGILGLSFAIAQWDKIHFCLIWSWAPTKVIIEKSCSGRFLWNTNWDLGWIWAGSATLEAGFFMFSWAKKIFKKQFRRGKHFWDRMKIKNIFFFLKKLKKKLRLRHIFNCVLLY